MATDYRRLGRPWEKPDTLSRTVSRALDRHEPGFRAVGATAGNCREALARLLNLLHDRGVLSIEDVETVLDTRLEEVRDEEA